MKKSISLIFLLMCSTFCVAQTIDNPAFERCDVPAFHITKVKIAKDTTYVFCSYYAEADSWASISKDTYLRDSKSHKAFPLLRCDGLPYSPEERSFSKNESCQFLFCFPSISGIEQFDFIESEVEKGFNIYSINLKRSYKTSYSDTELNRISEMVLAYDSSDSTEEAMLLKDYATSLNNLVSYNASIGNQAEAIRLGTTEMEIRKKVFGKEHPSYIESLCNLVGYYTILGKYSEANKLQTEVTKVLKNSNGVDNIDYITSLSELALYHAYIGNYSEAIKIEKETLEIKKKLFGTENFDYAQSVNNLAGFYSAIGNYMEAIILGKEAVEIKKKLLGNEHPEYALSLRNLALYYSHSGKLSEAITLGTEAMKIRKRILGTEHTDYVLSLCDLADYNYKIGKYAEAIRFGTEVMEIRKRLLGTENPLYAATLNSLAQFFSDYCNNAEAIKLGTEATEISKRVLGTDNSNYATSLNNLAAYNSYIGNYAEAIRLGTEALDIRKRVLGTEHPDYTTSLNNLAASNSGIGNYSEAIRLGTEAMKIRKRVLGIEHPNYAKSLSSLATYYYNIGNYTEAISLETKAMVILKRVYGTKHLDYARSLSNLATYNLDMGKFSEAIRLGTEAMEIRKRALGTEHPDYATSLSNLGALNFDIGNYAEGIRLGTETMEIRKRTLGTNHPDYAMSLNNLAASNALLGNYTEAIRLGKESLEIRKRILGTGHPDYAMSLSSLATLNSYVGNFSDAIRLETKAMEIRKRLLGTEHPHYVISLGNLASNYFIYGNYEKAYHYTTQQIGCSRNLILNNLGELSSNYQRLLWTTQFAYTYFSTIPNVVSKYANKESISELYNNTCLFAKGILLNTSIEMRKLILESRDSSLINKYSNLSANINIYNKLIEKPIKDRFINTDSLNRVIQKQEMELARESKVYGDYTRNLTITWKDVQQNLIDGDIAIEFLDYTLVGTDSTMYIALTLKKDYDAPHMVTLFETDQLNAIPKDIYYTQTGVTDLVWKPLEEELTGVKDIYFAPSGELHRIGIEYLPISKAENICDVYTLHRLSSTRQLAVVQDETEGKNSVLYGGLDYDEKSNAISTDSTSTKEAVLRSAYSRANVDSLSLRSSFDYLEGTKKEADMIAENMKHQHVPYIYYSGIDGTEESFKQQDGARPKLMHIATHGFFLTEEEAEKSRFARPEMELMTEWGQMAGRSVEDKSMTRSGLLFSGCNHAIHHEQIPDGEEDGILTAQEISMLDLRGLDLVVLSACQTGLGDVISGEGVFGLQRGFKKAGARTILMSLNKVDDEATRILMVEFYKNLMRGKAKHQSLKDAQKYLRQVQNGKYDNPKYWASFIMLDGLN